MTWKKVPYPIGRLLESATACRATRNSLYVTRTRAVVFLNVVVRTYKENFTAVCQQMFEYGLQTHEEREDELRLFRDAIDAAKQENRQQAAVKIDEFMVYKHKVGLSVET